MSGAYKLNRSLNSGYLTGYIFLITLSQYSKIGQVMNIWQLFSRHYLLMDTRHSFFFNKLCKKLQAKSSSILKEHYIMAPV